MIDARDYDSTEDLAEAMDNERDIVLLEATRKRIAEVESFINTATGALEMLKRDAEKLNFKIRAYQHKVTEKQRGKTFENETQKESN